MPDHERSRQSTPQAPVAFGRGTAPRAPGDRARETSRGLNYAEGRAALQPREPAATERSILPGTPDEAAHFAQTSFVSAGVGVTSPEARTLHSADGLKVVLDAGTRLSASLSEWGVYFQANPGILLKLDYKPDLRLKSLHWSFAEARFVVDAETDWLWDPFSLIGNAAEKKIQGMLDSQLKPHLPEAVKKKGYSPKGDTNLAGTVAALSQTFAFVSGSEGAAGAKPGAGGPATAGPQAAGGADDPRKGLTDPSASLAIAMPEDVHIPLGVQNLELLIKKGQRIDLSATAKGNLARPVLERIVMNASNEAITVLPTGGNFKELKKLVMNSVTVSKGGAFSFDYDLSAEQMGNGLLALLALGAMAAGEHVGQVPDVKLQGIRKEIDTALQNEVPPRFKELLFRYDALVPGLSLKSLFGV